VKAKLGRKGKTVEPATDLDDVLSAIASAESLDALKEAAALAATRRTEQDLLELEAALDELETAIAQQAVGGQNEPQLRAFADLAFDLQPSAMQLDQALGDGEPQARAAEIAADTLSLAERLDDMRQFVARDAAQAALGFGDDPGAWFNLGVALGMLGRTDDALAAFDKAGGADYLARMADEQPIAFMALLSKVLPTQINLGTKADGINRRLRRVARRLPIDEAG
jgi:tetratricopeptide (TPR) repeat protein